MRIQQHTSIQACVLGGGRGGRLRCVLGGVDVRGGRLRCVLGMLGEGGLAFRCV